MNASWNVELATIAVVLLVVLSSAAVSTVFVGAIAAAPADMAGSGTEADPYVVTNVTQLQAMNQDLAANYTLGNDIDASATSGWNGGAGFEPIGTFTGTFDGDNHTISDLYIERAANQQGLFGVSSGTITNVGLENVDISGADEVGGLVGENQGEVRYSYVTGDVSSSNAGAGGIVGHNDGDVRKSNSTASVYAENDAVGGIAGVNDGTVTESYAAGAVTGQAWADQGGIVGEPNSIGSVSDSYWDTQTTGKSTSVGSDEDVYGLTTAEMTGTDAETNMNGLDFDTVWATTDSYPALQWSLMPANVTYSNPSLTPDTLYSGSAVNGTVTVANDGGLDDDYAVSLSVDGEVIAWENGTIAGDSTKHITILKTLWETGERTVTISGGSVNAPETVTVEAAANPKYHGGPGNLGHYPDEAGPTATPEEVWNITDGTPMVMQPTIVGDTMYMAFHDGGKLYALDPETGAEKWNATPGGSSGSTWTTPAYANGVLYLGSNANMLHAINATNGNEIWNYSTQNNYVRSAPAVVDGVVYFGSNNGNLTAVNATTGEELWYYTMYQPVLVESNPAVVDGVVYIAGNDDNVTALNATDGTKIWNYTLIDESQSDPTVANNTVFVGSDSTMGETSGDGQVYALNATDGTERWNYTMSGDVDSGQVYADGVLYAGSRGGDLVALHASNGTEIWNVSGSGFRGAPVVAGGVLYISDFGSDEVLTFNATDGTELWSYESPTGQLYPTPLAWNSYLYYGSGSHFYALKSDAIVYSNLSVPSAFDEDTSATVSAEVENTEGSSYPYNASLLIDGVAQQWQNGTLAGGANTTVSFTWTPSTPGDYDVAVNATVAQTVTVNDTTAPSADAGSDQTIDEDTSTDFNGTASDNVGVTSYEWDFGDGNTTTGQNATHSFADPGTYTVTLKASDAAGNNGTDTLTVTVNDTTAPTADAGSDQTVDEDTVVNFDGSNSTDNDAIASYEWNFSDGSTNATGATPSHTFDDPGAYTVTLNVTDSAGNSATDTLTVTVTDATPPAADAGSNQSVDEDTVANFDGSGSSDNGTIASYEWNFSDGSANATGATPTHTFADPGTYTVTLNVTDAAGNSGFDTLVVTVNDTTAPTADAGSNQSVDEDTSLNFDGSSSTDNDAIASYEWDFDDGNSATGASPSHTFADPGNYTVELTVTDNGGNQDTDTLLVTVNDTTAPVADAGSDQTVTKGSAVTFNASGSTDNGAIASYFWNFSDGTNSTNMTATHTYSAAGTYTVTLNVTDTAGNLGSDAVNVTVKKKQNQSPPPAAPPGDDDDEQEIVVKASDANASVTANVAVRNVDSEAPVVIDLGTKSNDTDESDGNDSEPAENISMSTLTVNVSNSDDFTLNVTTYERPSKGGSAGDGSIDGGSEPVDSEKFLAETGATPAGYVVVDHSVSDDDIEDVTFTFRVNKRYLETTGLDPDSIALYRGESAGWRALDATVVDETATHLVYQATSPGLSVFTIGSTVPVFEVTSTDLSAMSVAPGEEVEVTIDVANLGGADGSYAAALLVDGERVADDSLAVAAFDEGAVTLSTTFDEPGTYELVVGEEVVGTVAVEAQGTTQPTPTATATPTQTPASDGGINPLLVGVVVLFLAAGLGGVYWQRREDEDDGL